MAVFPVRWPAGCCSIGPTMKKNPPSSSAPVTDGFQESARPGRRASVNDILRAAYRRHSRGKVARAAMLACLGQ